MAKAKAAANVNVCRIRGFITACGSILASSVWWVAKQGLARSRKGCAMFGLEKRIYIYWLGVGKRGEEQMGREWEEQPIVISLRTSTAVDASKTAHEGVLCYEWSARSTPSRRRTTCRLAGASIPRQVVIATFVRSTTRKRQCSLCALSHQVLTATAPTRAPQSSPSHHLRHGMHTAPTGAHMGPSGCTTAVVQRRISLSDCFGVKPNISSQFIRGSHI